MILPDAGWPELLRAMGRSPGPRLHVAWTYDHLSAIVAATPPRLGSIPMLAAAAPLRPRCAWAHWSRASPNFRHPVVLAYDAMTLDQISAGRSRPGHRGRWYFDSEVLGQPVLTPAERSGAVLPSSSKPSTSYCAIPPRRMRAPTTRPTNPGRFPDVYSSPVFPSPSPPPGEGDVPGCTIRTDVGHLRPAQTAHRRCRLVRPGPPAGATNRRDL